MTHFFRTGPHILCTKKTKDWSVDTLDECIFAAHTHHLLLPPASSAYILTADEVKPSVQTVKSVDR